MVFENLFLIACPSCLWKLLGLLALAFLLGLWLGNILWGKYKRMVEGLQADIRGLNAKITDQGKEYASLKYAHEELQKKNNSFRSRITGMESDKASLQLALDRCKKENEIALKASAPPAPTIVPVPTPEADSEPLAAAPKTGYATIFQSDNLQIIEGIGPKISKTLHEAGVNNWAELSIKDNDQLIAILTNAKINTKINNPKTWPEQGRLAKEGQWEKLIEYQKFLDTGMDNKGDFDTPSKVEKLYMKAIGFAGAKNDNLRIIEGIGPKIEELLKKGGINTWQELARASVDSIQTILSNAGDRFKLANPSTWPKQASLAAQEKWQELKEYQDYLDGGNEPTK